MKLLYSKDLIICVFTEKLDRVLQCYGCWEYDGDICEVSLLSTAAKPGSFKVVGLFYTSLNHLPYSF